MKKIGKNKNIDVDKFSTREKYWNEDYVRYWKARVDEANDDLTEKSLMVNGDSKTSSDDLYNDVIELLRISSGDNVLEIGCGFGRSLHSLCQASNHVTAVDISEEMISAAKLSCKDINIDYYVSPSESLPIADNVFDVVVCFAAFDAMYQTEALIEINRVSKKGARILITGKNDDYDDCDEAALAAEVGARKKNHPNYFTDVIKLIENIDGFGFAMEFQRYFERRGDFSMDNKNNVMPAKFYEYLLVLSKVSENKMENDFVISDKVSKTYIRQEM